MPRMRRHISPVHALLLGSAMAAIHSSAPAGADSRDSLAATTAVPWNPPRPVAAREAWEQAINFPGRVVSLPFAAAGAGLRSALIWIEDRNVVTLKPITAPGDDGVKQARPFTFQSPRLGDRAGIGGAVILRTPTTTVKAPALSARYAATIHDYNSTQFAASTGPFSLTYGYDWQPQMQFFGIGRETSDDPASDYAFQREYVRAAATFTFPRDSVHSRPIGEVRAWAGPRSAVTRRGREGGRASFETFYPGIAASVLDQRVDHFLYGGGLALDWREGAPHWSRGGRLRVDVERMDAPIRALALHSAEERGAVSTRLVADGEIGFSFYRDPRTIRLRAHVGDLSIQSHEDRFLFADLSRLGGREGLAGFTPGRFIDRDVLWTRATYIFPLSRLLEADLHGEWGAVYHDVWREASLANFEHSFGFTFRGRSDRKPRGSVGLDFCREGVRVNYAFGFVE